MMYYEKVAALAVVVLVAALSGCGKHTSPASQQNIPVTEAHSQPTNANATVLGAVKENDWYMVVSALGSAKPLVIWSESKSTCERDVGEFSLKAVDPTSKAEAPKSWCMQGKEIRSRLGS